MPDAPRPPLAASSAEESQSIVVVVAFSRDMAVVPEISTRELRRVTDSGSYVLVELEGGDHAVFERIRWLLSSGGLHGGAVFESAPPASDLWKAYEWRGALVVDRTLSWEWLLDTGWIEDHDVHRDDLAVLRPAGGKDDDIDAVEVETEVEYRAAVEDGAAVWLQLSFRPDLAESRSLFGELADPRIGGSVALLVLSGARSDRAHLTLRSPAALGLRVRDEPTRISWHQRAGEVQCRAIGLQRGSMHPAPLEEFAEPGDMERAWAALAPGGGFAVLAELEAVVDPEIVVPIGQVFEQTSVNDVQTLAAAREGRAVVTPGRLGRLALPAWCLNQSLRPPAGEPVRSTPLVTAYPSGTSQGEVWGDRRRRLA